MSLILYDYWRSSAAYRVRIALNLKGLAYTSKPVHLRKHEQQSEAYKKINPMQSVPALVMDGVTLTQSLAIIAYLEETHPTPPLMPKDAVLRAHARAMAMVVACDMHPINNLRVLRYLKQELGVSDEAKDAWYLHWLNEGLTALETMAAQHAGKYCIGDEVSLADLCLVPQLYNARRFNCPLDAYPTLLRIDAACNALPAFDKARPENQPDAEK